MKINKIIFILMLFTSTALYSNISVSNKIIIEEKKYAPVEETINIIQTNYIIDENSSSYIKIDGDDIVENKNDLAVFQYFPPPDYTRTNPFRYTEVSFFITFPFIYTYALLISGGFNAIEELTPRDRDRSAYRRLQTSELLFTFIGATLCAAAVAYGNYSDVYGKRSREQKPTVSFAPVVETVGNNTGAGFIFSFSYPYGL